MLESRDLSNDRTLFFTLEAAQTCENIVLSLQCRHEHTGLWDIYSYSLRNCTVGDSDRRLELKAVQLYDNSRSRKCLKLENSTSNCNMFDCEFV